MIKTYTPDLPPDVLDRLEDCAAQFRPDFRRDRQTDWAHVYLHGFLIDGERKSIEPLSRRVTLPDGLEVTDSERALQNVVNQAAWDEQSVGKRYRLTMAGTFASPDGIFVIDDTGFPKQGKHSVVVQRRYCGVPGQRTNCQVAPSIHYAGSSGHFPLSMRLYLPESWLGDQTRLDKAGVPESGRRPLSKGGFAPGLLDEASAESLPGRTVVADAGYGVSGEFREGQEQRGLQYVIGVTDEMVVFTSPPGWEKPKIGTGGRPRKRHRLSGGSPRPISLKALAAKVPLHATEGDVAQGDQGEALEPLRLVCESERLRDWATGCCVGAEPVRALIEEQADGKTG